MLNSWTVWGVGGPGAVMVLGHLHCRGVLLSIWIIVGQGRIALSVGAVVGCLNFFLSSISSLFFLPLWEMVR